MEFNIVVICVVFVYKIIKLDIVFILKWILIISIVLKLIDSVDILLVFIWGYKLIFMIEKLVGLLIEMRIIFGWMWKFFNLYFRFIKRINL